MAPGSVTGGRWAPSLDFVLFCILLTTLWVAGGASRADVVGQVVVRLVSASVLIIASLFVDRPRIGAYRPICLFVAGAALLATLQLIPLPPAVWQSLPGRSLLAQAATLSGQAQPWRPISMAPGATLNALASLIVPIAAIALFIGLRPSEKAWTPGLVLIAVVGSVLVGLMQFSGEGGDNPLINEVMGEVSGMFANRNHLALLLAIGCLLIPAWALEHEGRRRWRGPTAIGLILVIVLTLLATGSRTGIVLGILSLVLGAFAVQRQLRRGLRRYPRWALPAVIVVVIAAIALAVLASVAADRAVSIDRIFAIDAGQDMRRLGLPTVFAMVKFYFPVGAGLGTFDPVFRIHEPFVLLDRTYFNHAHNDLIEIVLDAGLPGLLLLLTGIAWWVRASIAAWWPGDRPASVHARIGSAILLMVWVASAFDYPARTPMIMALVVIAGCWLADPLPSGGVARALPKL